MAKKKDEEKVEAAKEEELQEEQTGEFAPSTAEEPEAESKFKRRDVFAFLVMAEESQEAAKEKEKQGQEVEKDEIIETPETLKDVQKALKKKAVAERFEQTKERVFKSLPAHTYAYSSFWVKAGKIKEGE